SYAPGLERLSVQQNPYSKPTWPSSQFGAQSEGTFYAHRDVGVDTVPDHNDFYPLERISMHSSPSMIWQVEGLSAATPNWSNPFASLGHSGGVTTTSSVLSNATAEGFPVNMPQMCPGQLPFDWSTSDSIIGQTSLENVMVGPDLGDLMKCDQSQKNHEAPMRKENDHSSPTSFDLSQACTLGTSPPAAETQASTHVAKIGNRHVCSICFNSHSRPSRATACENRHRGVQPFVCDGACGDPAW
ncbi:hypothetical protein FRC19_000713, partial [Serendipita sp. 401]